MAVLRRSVCTVSNHVTACTHAYVQGKACVRSGCSRKCSAGGGGSRIGVAIEWNGWMIHGTRLRLHYMLAAHSSALPGVSLVPHVALPAMQLSIVALIMFSGGEALRRTPNS